MSDKHPKGADVLRVVMSVARDSLAAQGIELPEPIIDGGGPSSTFTAAVFAGELLGQPSWGAHVAVRIPDAIYDLRQPGLTGPHLGVFRQVFFSLPESMLGGQDPEKVTQTLMADIDKKLMAAEDPLLFRAYEWNAISTRMTGVAKEVNLAGGMLQGMEIAQLNHIEQVGGVKLDEPCYLIVIGVDRLTYYLALRDYYQDGKELTSAGDSYRMHADYAQALERLHHNIVYAEQLQPNLKETFDQELQQLTDDLAKGEAMTEDALARFRAVNILLETLFMTRRISGGLRQSYIGKIGELAKRLAKAVLAHPEECLKLVTAKQVSDIEQAVSGADAMLLRSATLAGDRVSQAAADISDLPALPDELQQWHAGTVAAGINQDLLDALAGDKQQALSDWVAATGADAGNAVRNGDADLPLGFAAIKLSEERPVLGLDLSMSPDELLRRMDGMSFVGVDGNVRRERHENLIALLESQGVEVPDLVKQTLPYLGVEDLFRASRVFERSVIMLVKAWFERHRPDLLNTYCALSQNEAPKDPTLQICWAALRVELVARYLILRAEANKPLWQDPYGARAIINRRLLPLWKENPLPESLRRHLIEAAVEGEHASPEATETVKAYLLGKLLAEE